MRSIFSTILVTLGLALGFVLPALAVTQYVANPASCTATDPVTFPGQSCAPLKICGNSSGTAECFDTATIAAPTASSTTTAAPLDSSLAGGYIIDCNATSDAAAPFCNNNGSGFCNATTANYTTNRRTTICIGGLYASSTPGDCRSGYQDCAAPTTSCEVQTSVTANANPNTTYGASCSFACLSGYLDCDGNGTGSGANGCEITVGGACTAGGLPGTYGAVCSGAVGNCIVPTQHYISGVEAKYSSASSAPHLWGVQYGSDPLAWLWGFNASTTGSQFFIDNGGRVGVGTTSTSQAQLTVKATSTRAVAAIILDDLGFNIASFASTTVPICANDACTISQNYPGLYGITLGSGLTRPGFLKIDGDGGAGIYDGDIIKSIWTGNSLMMISGSITSTYGAQSIVLGRSSFLRDGALIVDQNGNITTSGTLRVYGGTTLNGLTFTSASGTAMTSTLGIFTSVTSTNLNISGPTNLSNTTLTNATTTNLYVSGLTNLAGALTFTTASGTAITSTRAIFDSVTSTNIRTDLLAFSTANGTTANLSNLTVSVTADLSSAAISGLSTSDLSDASNIVLVNNQQTITGAKTFSSLLTFADATGSNLSANNVYAYNPGITSTLTSVGLTINQQNNDGLFFVNNAGSVSASGTLQVFGNGIFNASVGIGTTSPQAPLAVRVGNGDGTLLVGAPFANHVALQLNSSTLATTHFNLMSGFYNGNLIMNRPAGAFIHFRENNDSNQMSINPGGTVSVTGNFAIGTSTANQALVIGNAGPAGGNGLMFVDSLGSISTSGTLRVFGTSTLATTTFAVGTSASPTISFVNDINTGFFSPAADQVGLSTNGLGRWYTDTNGRTTFGTTTIIASTTVHIPRGTLTINVPSSTQVGASTNTEAYYSVEVVGHLAAVMSATRVKMFDVTDPTRPLELGAVSSTEVSGFSSGFKLDFDGKYVFAPGFTNNINTYNFSNPRVPKAAGVYVGGSVGNAIVLSGNRLFSAVNSNGLLIHNIANPELAPILISTSATTTIKGVAVVGDYAYTVEQGVMRIIGVSSTVPQILGQINLTNANSKKDIACSGGFCYIADATGGLIIVNVDNPSAPVIASSTTAFGSLTSIVVSGRYVHAAQGSNFLTIDVSSSTRPFQANIYAAGGGTINGLEINGRFAYLATSAGLKIVDLTGLDVANASIDNLLAHRMNIRDRLVVYGSMAVAGPTSFSGSVRALDTFSAGATSTFGGNVILATSTANIIKKSTASICVLFSFNVNGPNPVTTSTITCPPY